MADQYAREAARVVALQLADCAGFDVVQQSCVEILADLLLRFINEAGAGSHHYAELAGRSETNPVDVTMALNDMRTSIPQLRDFLKQAPEMGFEANISAFPLRKKSKPPPTFLERGEAPPPHIPLWLPALPDRHTYKATPVYPGHEKDPQKRQMQLTEQRQRAETALVRLQARLASDNNQLLASKLPKPEGAEDGGQGQQAGAAAGEQQAGGAPAAGAAAAASSNPFFAVPWEVVAAKGEQPQQPQPAAAAPAAGAAGKEQPAARSDPGPKVEWEQLAWDGGAGVEGAAGSAGGSAGGGFVQQLFASSHNWKAQQQRKARIATSGRAVREAFGDAYDEQAAVRLGKRQKRAGGGPSAAAVAAAAAADPTRLRVEGILAASSQSVLAPSAAAAAAAHDDLMQEQI